MAQVIWRTSDITGDNQDKKRGGTVTGSFYQYSGSLPPSGSTLQNVEIYFSEIYVYSTTSAGFTTPYGSITLGLDFKGGFTTDMNANSSILNFEGGNIAFTVTGGRSTTSNVLNVREGSYIQIKVNYVPSSPSAVSLDKSIVRHGEQVTARITAVDSSFTHAVVWRRNSTYSTTVNLAAGDTDATITLPSTWPTGSATCTVTTYFNGSEVGSSSTSFTVAIDPSSISPTAGTLTATLVQPSSIPSNWGIYVKGYSKVKMSISGCSPGSGLTYKSINYYYGSENYNSTSETVHTSPAINETGTLECSAVITNSGGNSATTNKPTITVYDYFSPSFLSLMAFRCNASGTPSDTGKYVSVLAKVNYASVNGKNSLAVLQAAVVLDGTASTAATIQNGVATIIGGNLSGSNRYQVQVTAIDQIQNNSNTYSRTTVAVLTSDHVIFCKDGGLNVAFGMEGTINNAMEINPAWAVWHGEQRLDGVQQIQYGGTGASTASAARQNLGAASAEHKHDIEDVSGAVPIDKGGTGSTTAAAARNALGITPSTIGAAPSQHNHDASAISTGTFDLARLPFKFAFGSTEINGDAQTYVDYSYTGFTSTPAVFVTYATTSANWSGDNGAIKVSSITKSGCNIIVGGNWSNSRPVNWFAIGN